MQEGDTSDVGAWHLNSARIVVLGHQHVFGVGLSIPSQDDRIGVILDVLFVSLSPFFGTMIWMASPFFVLQYHKADTIHNERLILRLFCCYENSLAVSYANERRW